MKDRLDRILVDRGLFPSREKARRSIMAGLVFVEGQRLDKPGTSLDVEATIEVKGAKEPFVSRAGRKLAAALDHFSLTVEGWTCLDVGASTGGFTDCLLQAGAVKVFAVDVGYNQLDYRLRSDPRVIVMEKVNARYLEADAFEGQGFNLVTLDLSFISLTKVVPAVLPHVVDGGYLLPLIKPQFEAPRGSVGKGGILRDSSLRRQVVEERIADLEGLGLRCQGEMDSPIQGMGGNQESMALFRWNCSSNKKSIPTYNPLDVVEKG